jgi:GntR family transcriptional repressor for pyruvate dehydrogenase complex
MEPTPLLSVRLYEQMAQRIREQIIAGSLKAGDQLPNERTLAQMFSVSRTVVREATKTLKQEGLIEVRAGLGTFVVDNTGKAFKQSFGLLVSIGKQEHIHDIIQIREILEPEIAALAAQYAFPSQIVEMEQAIQSMDANLDSITDYAHMDHSFHLILAQATQNIILPHLMASIVDLLQELRKQIAHKEGARERGQEHHRSILDAVKKQDSELARVAMRAHLLQVRLDSGINDKIVTNNKTAIRLTE